MSCWLALLDDLSKERSTFNDEQLPNLYRLQNEWHFMVDPIKRNDMDGVSFGGSERREMGITLC
jgi:hypothetical protein